MKKIVTVILLALSLVSCKKNNEKETKEFHFDFAQGVEGWQSFFSDYPVGSENSYQLEFSHSFLPAPLNGTIRAVKISGNNHSDDLLSFIVRKFENLKPNTDYSVNFNIEFASNATSNGVGIGGSPDLEIGVGGLSYIPQNNISQGYYRPNFISRLQSHESNDVLKSAGRIGVSTNFPTPFMLVNRNNFSNPVLLKTNNNGELWLMIGTDSGFEGTTSLYYKSIGITLKKE
ncbi:hypothetical protein [Ferruginibacter sp.]|nr:hypothetical protein [Ferruginibacter sp.]